MGAGTGACEGRLSGRRINVVPMYDRVQLDDVEARELDGIDQRVKPIGYELGAAEMRPNVWVFDAGDAGNRHRQREQEELYVVVNGRFEMEVEGDTFEIESGHVVLVAPESWRQVTAIEDGTLLVIGAPNVSDDGIRETD